MKKSKSVCKKNEVFGDQIAVAFLGINAIIKLHKPHPRPELKRYQLDYMEETLKNRGLIK